MPTYVVHHDTKQGKALYLQRPCYAVIEELQRHPRRRTEVKQREPLHAHHQRYVSSGSSGELLRSVVETKGLR